jgi:hypothetical protein
VPKFQWPLFGNELEEFNFGSVPNPAGRRRLKLPFAAKVGIGKAVIL